MLGYSIAGVTTADKTFALPGNYAALFSPGVSVMVRHSTGNNGTYTVTGGATNYNLSLPAPFSGTTRTEITVLENVVSGVTGGLISRNRGILWAVEQICGTPSSPKHDEYLDYVLRKLYSYHVHPLRRNA